LRYFVLLRNFIKRMKKLLFIFSVLALLFSCDDGDIIVTSFDFEEADLETCGEAGSYVFFKINNDAQESISLRLGTAEELFLTSSTVPYILDGSSNFINYRKYEGSISSSYFCADIPPTTPLVTIDYLGASGIATIVTETTLDDNDNIEEVDLALDTDNDDIPNYYDFDDDGDNVPTAVELGPDPSNPANSDDDSIPDYLDSDDDNDGVLTRNEDLNGDLNPANDTTDGVPNYLNNMITIETTINQYREHSYSLSSNIQLQIDDLVLTNSNEQITQEFLDLGKQANVRSGTVTITPEL